jgi:hypothetical protein
MAAGLALALTLGAIAIQAEAPYRNEQTFGPVGGVTVTFSVPATYSSCQAYRLTDALTTTGIPWNWRLLGQVNVGYIGPAGFVITEVVRIDQLGNLNLQIQYPPHSSIEPNPRGDFEYHVEPQIAVYDASGQRASFINYPLGTLGPDQDWDVFCIDPPPPPPPPPPTELAGCTPGYWKVPQHFDSYPAPITPGTSFNSIFTGYPLADVVWVVALDGGGGAGLDGALKILRRAAAAAYLNALALNYGYSPAQVKAAVLAAAASGNRDTILGLAARLDTLNNRGCPLN